MLWLGWVFLALPKEASAVTSFSCQCSCCQNLQCSELLIGSFYTKDCSTCSSDCEEEYLTACSTVPDTRVFGNCVPYHSNSGFVVSFVLFAVLMVSGLGLLQQIRRDKEILSRRIEIRRQCERSGQTELNDFA